MRPSIVTGDGVDTGHQLVYLDAQGNKTFSTTDAFGFPNRKSFVTDYTGSPLFVDTHGLRTDVPPTTLVVDNAGADITVYALASGSVNFSAITVEVSTNGTTWKAATAVGTAVRIPGDGGQPIGYVKSYDIGDNTGTLYKYVRISGSSATSSSTRVGIVAGHGGPENSSLETAFPTVVVASLTTLPTAAATSEVGGAVGAPNGVFTQLQTHATCTGGACRITLGSNGLDLPALIRVNRVAAIPVHADARRPRLVPGRRRHALGRRVERLRDQRHARLGLAGVRPHRPTPARPRRDRSSTTARSRSGCSLPANATSVTLSQAPARSVAPRRVRRAGAGQRHRLHDERLRQHGHAHRVDHGADGRARELPGRRRRHADAELLARRGDSSTLQLRNDLANSGTVTVTTYKVISGFTVSGATLTVAARRARGRSCQPPGRAADVLRRRARVRGVEDSEGRLVLTPSFQRQDAGIYDPVTHAAVNDPFGIQLTYDSTDPLVHFAGDPALHTAGEVQRYLGGEPIVDELGRPVLERRRHVLDGARRARP